MARCCNCKKQETVATKDGKKKRQFSLTKARGGVFCPDCLSAHHDRLFPAPTVKQKQAPPGSLVVRRREICGASMVTHNTVDLSVYARKVETPKSQKQKVGVK